ncbi:MAG: prolyl oligopeptidase family serine peptidase, partial [Chitinophagaceae bacterium]|nr:prolyl oligopeptidase family serine peptidase [Chitinophagaceae bacterium]
MKKILLMLLTASLVETLPAQAPLTPETMWKLGRVSGVGVSDDQKQIVFTVSNPDMATNKSNKKTYQVSVDGGAATEITATETLIKNTKISPDGKYLLEAADVKMRSVFGKDFYPDLPKSNVQIYDGLNYRHWDEWEDGNFSHVFIHTLANGKKGKAKGKDIMSGQPYDCPQKPFGGDEDFIWSNDGKEVLYVTKPKVGTAYALSTNTDIFSYNVATGAIINITDGRMGYDINPAFSKQGTLAWLSMEREGYEADKQDIIVRKGNDFVNVTKDWDGSVNSFRWSNDGTKIYFEAPVEGTLQLFVVNVDGLAPAMVRQITNGAFDINGLVGQAGENFIVSRTDMNHSAELYSVHLADGRMRQLTHVNDEAYKKIATSKIESKLVTTTDGKQMLVYVIFPPDFDATKKYPTILYCQGGPQSPLTQSYSFRWNFSLMAAGGYIIVAPNRRGMYGHGREWNEQISKDWGGQVMKDYLSAIDEVSKEAYVDKERLGCIGASFGGYSAFWLAGNHNNRFKTFISHDGIFDMRSM